MDGAVYLLDPEHDTSYGVPTFGECELPSGLASVIEFYHACFFGPGRIIVRC